MFLLFSRQQQQQLKPISPQQFSKSLAQLPYPRLLTSLKPSVKLLPEQQSFQPLPSRPPISELRPFLQLIVELPIERQFFDLTLSPIPFFRLTLLDHFTKLANLIGSFHPSFLQSQLVPPILFVKLPIEQQLFLFNTPLEQL